MSNPVTTTNGDGSKNTVPGANAHDPRQFDWPLAYDAEKFLSERMAAFLALNSFARELAQRMRDQTATDFFEWVDHLVLSPEDEQSLRAVGFVPDTDAEAAVGDVVMHHPRATLP